MRKALDPPVNFGRIKQQTWNRIASQLANSDNLRGGRGITPEKELG